MMDTAAINHMKTNRLNDELMLDTPNPLVAAKQFPQGIEQSPFSTSVAGMTQRRLQVSRVKPDGNTYLITGGYFEYVPVYYRGEVFTQLKLDIDSNTEIVIKTTLKWKYSSYPYSIDTGTPESGRVFYLTGEYVVISAELVIAPSGTVFPSVAAFNFTTDETLINVTDIYFPALATINDDGDVVVDSGSLYLVNNFIYPGGAFSLLNIF